MTSGEKSVLPMVALWGQNFENWASPDFLGTFKVNAVVSEIPLALALVPLKTHKSVCHITCTQSILVVQVRLNPGSNLP